MRDRERQRHSFKHSRATHSNICPAGATHAIIRAAGAGSGARLIQTFEPESEPQPPEQTERERERVRERERERARERNRERERERERCCNN